MKKNITFLVFLVFAISNVQGQLLTGNGTAKQKHAQTMQAVAMEPCSPVATLNEDFETDDWPLPPCWSSIVRGSEAWSANIGVIYGGYQSQKSVQMANNDAQNETSDIILVSPPLSTLSLGTYRLKFFADGIGVNSLQIGTLDNNTDTAVFSPLATVATTANYAEYAVSFAAYTGPNQYVGIRLNSLNTYNPLYLDNIRWELAPLCPDATQVAIAPITPETATINWISESGVNKWELVYALDSVTDPATLTPEVINTTPTKTLSGLSPDTHYNVWIRSVCGTVPGFWIGPVAFKSDCAPVSAMTENFDSVQTPALPSCWSEILRGPTLDTENATAQTTDYNQNSGPNAVRMSGGISNLTMGDDIILVSPNFGPISASPHRVKFFAKGDGLLKIGTLSSNDNSAVFSEFEGVQATNTLTEYTVNFAPYSGTDRYVGFRLNSLDYNTSVYIDDVRWEEVPLCPDVSQITVPVITETSATVNWEAGESETEWNVVYTDTAAIDPSTLTPLADSATSTSQDINDLTPNTTYKVWVRSVCGINKGAWIGPVIFKTACTAVTEFDENFDSATNTLPDCWSKIVRGEAISENANVNLAGYNAYSGTNSIEINNNNSTGLYDIILVSPALSNTGLTTHRLKFYAYSNEAAPMQIGTLATNDPLAEFNVMQDLTATLTYSQYVINFDNYTGTDGYIGIRLNAPENSSVFIDNVVWETIPLCPDVLNLTVPETTSDTATLSWEGDGSANNWQVVYGPESATDPDLLTPENPVGATTTTVNGLSSNTSYKFWARTVCGGTDGNGAWIGPVAFKTQCQAVNGLNENFDSTTHRLPDCWSAILRGPTLSSQAVVKVVSSNAYSGQKSLKIDNDNSNLSEDIILVSPAIENLNGGGYILTFKADGYDPTNFQVGTLDGNDNDAQFTLFEDLVTTNDYTDFSVDLSTYSGTDKYIGIRHNDSANESTIFLDDIKLESSLSTGGFDNAGLIYYPNPVKNTLNLSYTKDITGVSVYNLLGQLVIDNKNDAATSIVDMSHLPSGSYIVKVTTDNQIKTIKVVKE